MAVRFEYRYYDFEGNYFKVKIYRPGQSDTLYEIEEGGSDPVTISHMGGDKNSLEDTVVQGKQLEFSFFLPRADVSNIDFIFESQYQDYVLEYIDASGSTEITIFKGYVKPENLTKRYETNPPYIEINLPANDALADLSEFEFRDSNGDLIIGRKSVLQILKDALTPIAGTVLNFPFKVQLNTYEENAMSSDECVLEKMRLDTRSFLNGEIEDEDPMDCLSVVEEVLKSFNVVFRQEGEYYVITNYHELDSYEFEYNWDLVLQGRTATNNILNIDDKKYQPYIEEQKIHPFKRVYVTHSYDVVGNNYLPSTNDWNDWTVSNFYRTEIDSEDNTTIELWEDFQDADSPEPYLLSPDIYLPKISDTDYILIKFDYEIIYFLYAITTNCQLYFKIEIQRPNGDWSTPVYHQIDLTVRDKLISFVSTPNPNLIVSESGNYKVKISFTVKRGSYDRMIIYLKNPSIIIDPFAGRQRTGGGRGQRGSERGEDTNNTGYGRRRSDSTSVRRGDRVGRDTSIEDKRYKLEQEDGYEEFESTLMFADPHNYPNPREHTSLINVFYDESDYVSQSTWNSYGHTEQKPLIHIYAKNLINNRQEYKTYIRCRVYDRNHDIRFTNILLIESKYYFIAEYDRHYKDGYVELGLIEILTDQLTFTNGLEEIELRNIPVTDSPASPLDTDGIDQVGHGLDVGNVIRYDYGTKKYVKAQADQIKNAKAIGFVSEVINDDRFKFLSDDYVRSDSQLYTTLKSALNLEEGEYYFVSPTKPGEVVKASELKAGQIEQCVGYVTTKGLKVEVDAKNLELPGAKTDLSVTGEGTNASPIVLVNDELSPGDTYYYGTRNSVKGYWALEYTIAQIINDNAKTIINNTQLGDEIQVLIQSKIGDTKQSYLVETTADTYTQQSTWLVDDIGRSSIGIFTVKVFMRDLVDDTTEYLEHRLGWDYLESNDVSEDIDISTGSPASLLLEVDSAGYLSATIYNMNTPDNKRLFFCFERCLVNGFAIDFSMPGYTGYFTLTGYDIISGFAVETGYFTLTGFQIAGFNELLAENGSFILLPYEGGLWAPGAIGVLGEMQSYTLTRYDIESSVIVGVLTAEQSSYILTGINTPLFTDEDLGMALLVDNSAPAKVYSMNPETFSTTYLFTSRDDAWSQDIAHTRNKLWIKGSSGLLEYDVNWNPFSATYNRTITGVPSNPGLCAIDDTTLISVSGNDVYECDITTTTSSNTLKFTFSSDWEVTGDFVLTDDNKFLVLLNYASGSPSGRLAQYDYDTGNLETYASWPSTITAFGLYQWNNEIYFVTDNGFIYQVDKTSPYDETYIGSVGFDVNGASQFPEYITEELEYGTEYSMTAAQGSYTLTGQNIANPVEYAITFMAYMEDGVDGTIEAEIGSNGTDSNYSKQQTQAPPGATYSYYSADSANSYGIYNPGISSTATACAFSIWIYVPTLTNCAILGSSSSVDDIGFELELTSSGKLQAGLRWGGSSVHADTPDGVISENTWHHIYVTYTGDGSYTEIYVDNVLKGDNNQYGALPRTWNSSSYLSVDGISVLDRFTGYFGHFIVFQGELEDWQRNYNYNNGEVWYLD